MNLWQRKLLAYLHDPPGKPFNIAEHHAMAESLIRNAGFEPNDVAWFFDKICDHTAAAADRVVCPKSSALSAGWDKMAAFKHPLGGGELKFEQPINPAVAESQVAAKQPHGLDWTNLPEDKRDWAKVFLHWRLWPQWCAEAHPSLAHLPADTRVPDHTIWSHCSIVSALQTCVEIANAGLNAEVREFRPAFLLMQVGPVQEFIAQARTTRDLWSGSYLLSWLVAHGIKAITDQIGPDCVVYPALRGQPIFDFLHRDELYAPLGLWEEPQTKGISKRLHAEEHILTPTLPNRFLVIVPAWEAAKCAEAAVKAIHDELQQIADTCKEWFTQNNHPIPADAVDRWNQQIRQFLNITWQVWPWETDVQRAISGHEALQRAYDAAINGIPSTDLDPRNYRHRLWRELTGWKSEIIPDATGKPVIDNPGFAWAAHYAQSDRLHAARRNTRDFEPWAPNDPHRAAVKDMLSGKEEVIGSEDWQKGLAKISGHYFRDNERLGAINLIKRVWHKAYLHDKLGLERTPRFDSLPSIAAASFDLRVLDAAAQNQVAWEALLEFQKQATAAGEAFGATVSKSSNEREWLERTDASVFHLVEWDRRIRDAKAETDRTSLQQARAALAKLLGKDGVNDTPGRYVAVIAMDGDSMGKWVSGENAPPWRSQLAEETIAYFENHPKLAALLDQPRQLSPSYHVHLSEALANFALYLAGPIVECFDGQLIYAGGDDVLALLPAENALQCARLLRVAFRGDPQLPDEFEGAVRAREEQWGFVGLSRDPEKLKRLRRFIPVGYPLIVPGRRADISAGIAIGHMHSPLQNLVEAAREAEKRAKRAVDKGGYGKSAFAVSLFKRSGETIQWGAKWDSHAIELAQSFEDNFGEGKPLSGRFPYALAELLRNYEPLTIETAPQFDAIAVIRKDFEHVIRQQGRNHGKDVPASFVTTAYNYLEDCRGHRLDDFLGPFLTITFVTRGGEI